MVRRVEVSVPKNKTKLVLDVLKKNVRKVYALTVVPAEGTDILMFRCKEKHVRSVVYQLGEMGIGVSHGVIDIISLQMTKPRLTGTSERRQFSTTERQTIEEIYEIVDSGTHMTFDYLAFTFVAAIISAVGLITDSSVTVVASMLVSPLMGPILGIAFGLFIGDAKMMWKSIRTELVGVGLTFVVGMFSAWINLIDYDVSMPMTQQMSSRAVAIGLVAGAVVASPSGVGVALSVANTNVNSLVGVAISAALLPPIVNSGLLLVYAMHRDVRADLTAKTWYRGSAISLGLFFMNWALIFIFSLITFFVKGMRPDVRPESVFYRKSQDNLLDEKKRPLGEEQETSIDMASSINA